MSRGSMTASDRAVRSTARVVAASLLVTALLVAVIAVPRPLSAHPLDALSAAEIGAAISALRAAGHADAATRFPLITLAEPDKGAVLAWHPGETFARKAFVVARQQRIVYEGVVDLAAGALERWDAVPNVQPAISLDELTDAQKITIADPEWRAAMQRRGYVSIDPAKLFCAPLPAGSSGDPSEQGRRLVRVTCFDAAGTKNVWSRPIEGLLAIVDLDEKKVIRVVETGAVPVSRDAHDFVGPPPKSALPLNAALKNAHAAVEDGVVRWGQWSFHYRLDRRGGLIVSLLRYRDGERERLVLYRGSLAEMFVPYMDPDPNWAFRAWFDVGENDFGFMASPLKPAIDCPAGAAFLDAVLADSRGEPRLGKSVICLFERDTGAPLWRHAEGATASIAGQPATELVLRTIESLGNYDYIIDWVLTETGMVRIEVGATGIVMVKGVATRSMTDSSAAKDTQSGTLVAPNLVAVNHDHFLSFRLDLDIDGAQNTLVRQKLKPEPLAEHGAGGRSLWRVTEEPVTEEGAIAGAGHGEAESWRIVNPNVANALGQHPGYELRLGHTATSLLAPEDPAQRRAGFSGAPLWVTAYDPAELYAAGPYPNQSQGGDGLPAHAARHRPVDNADIVLWATLGFHHVPRPEDWPVMPTQWHSLSLVPAGFFARNPSIEPPRGSAPDAAKQ
jgi:primary-amine oxidase